MLGLNNLFNSLTGNGINKRNKDGETRLYRAVKNGDIKTVKRLLKDGADPNIPNAHKLTPLHHAAYWGESEMVDLLLKAGADVKADNGRGWTALHSAAVSGGMKARRKVIDLLKKAGARDDVKDKQGWTASDYMLLWEENAVAAEKLKQFLQIPNGLSPARVEKKPEDKKTGPAAGNPPGNKPCPPAPKI
jgi:ankyrin repeat protein